MILSLSNEAGSIILLAKIPPLRLGIFRLYISVYFLSNKKIIWTRHLVGEEGLRTCLKASYSIKRVGGVFCSFHFQ